MDPKTQATTAVQMLTPLVEGTRRDQLALPTPCTEWDVHDLINHVIGGGYMFAAGLRDETIDMSGGPTDLVGDDHVAAYLAAIASFNDALAKTDSLDKMVTLPFGTLPADAALQLAAGDLLVHSWDLATATGQPFEPPAEFIAAVDGFFHVAVNDDLRAAGLFGQPVDVDDDASGIARLVAYAGRQP